MQRGAHVLVAGGWIWLAGLLALAMFGSDVRRHHFESAGLAFGAGLLLLGWVHRSLRGPPDRGASGASRLLPGAVGTGVVAILAFAWAIQLGPLSDDFVLRRWAADGQWTPDTWQYLRPLPLAVWHLVDAVGAGWATLHAINLLLHGINAACVAWLAGHWLTARAGVVAGLTFALSPTATEAVAWNAGVFDLTASALTLVAVGLWTTAPSRALALVGILAAGLAALLSKEAAIAVPLLLILVTCAWSTGWADVRRRAGVLATGLAVGAGYVVVRGLLSPELGGHLASLPMDRREWKDLLLRPFAGLSVPLRTDTGLGMETYLMGLLALLLAGALAWQIARPDGSESEDGLGPRRASVLCVGLGWTLLTALPLLTQFDVAPTLEGSRYLYLPGVGFALMVAAAVAGRRWTLPHAVAMGTVLCLLAASGMLLLRERRVWLGAAAVRDTLLAQARGIAADTPCRSLRVMDAPATSRGAFVFREGLDDALAGIALTPDGSPCALRWDGSSLHPLGAP